MKIFKLFSQKKDKFQRAMNIQMREDEYDKAKQSLQNFLIQMGQSFKWIRYKAIGSFCDDPKENQDFIELMQEHHKPDFKKMLSDYQEAKKNFNKALTEK
jgi:recombinational DNA repair ATPase RecF